MKKLPSRQEFYDALRKSVEYIEQVDDEGSVDFEMMRWKEWVSKWPKIGTEEGGI